MNIETGQIRREEKLTPKQRGTFMALPRARVTEVTGMNRAQRRAWAREHRDELKREVEMAMGDLREQVAAGHEKIVADEVAAHV